MVLEMHFGFTKPSILICSFYRIKRILDCIKSIFIFSSIFVCFFLTQNLTAPDRGRPENVVCFPPTFPARRTLKCVTVTSAEEGAGVQGQSWGVFRDYAGILD